MQEAQSQTGKSVDSREKGTCRPKTTGTLGKQIRRRKTTHHEQMQTHSTEVTEDTIRNSVGIISMYLNVKLSKEDFFQECALIVLQAYREYSPKLGSINTVIGKIARRRNMQLRREHVKTIRNHHTNHEYMFEKYKDAGYRQADCPALHRDKSALHAPELPETEAILNVKIYHKEEKNGNRRCRRKDT